MLNKKIFAALILMVSAVAISSCDTDQQTPGWEYMPDMYRTPAIKTYESDPMFPDSLTALKPVEGTVPRGFMVYKKLPNSPEGYELSKTQLKKPAELKIDSASIEEAKVTYGIFCSQCHGEKGDGMGTLVQNEKFLGVPSYADREMTMGSIFYVITHGRNMMGSHASQLTPEERWKVADYVLRLRRELREEPAEAPDPEETANAVEAEKQSDMQTGTN